MLLEPKKLELLVGGGAAGILKPVFTGEGENVAEHSELLLDDGRLEEEEKIELNELNEEESDLEDELKLDDDSLEEEDVSEDDEGRLLLDEPLSPLVELLCAVELDPLLIELDPLEELFPRHTPRDEPHAPPIIHPRAHVEHCQDKFPPPTQKSKKDAGRSTPPSIRKSAGPNRDQA